MKKSKIYKAVFLASMFFLPQKEALAQGWPVFDATKLTSLISSFAAKLQGFPTSLQNIQGMKDLQAVVNPQKLMDGLGGLKSMGKDNLKTAGSDAFSFGESKVSKVGDRGPEAASEAAKAAYFVPSGGGPVSQEALEELNKNRAEARELAAKRQVATSLYMVTSHDSDVEERTKTVEEAMENAESSGSLVDHMNANTLATMANVYETMDQITLMLANMEQQVNGIIAGVPPGGYTKPKATVIDGQSIDKGEANVVLE